VNQKPPTDKHASIKRKHNKNSVTCNCELNQTYTATVSSCINIRSTV